MNMPLDVFLTALYTLVDDWYKESGSHFLAGKVGRKPDFSDSEVMTLSIAQHWCGFKDEEAWLRFVRLNFSSFFPRLLEQSQFNRRARGLCWLINRLRFELVQKIDVFEQDYRLIDGTPIHVRHWRRYGKTHLMLPGATLGYCAAKKETFYGYRLVVLTTLTGVITDWELTPANADEREAAMDMFYDYRNLKGLGDKGFLDKQRQSVLREDRNIELLTPKRANQKEQNAVGWDALMNRVRRLIETTFSQAKAFFGLEKPGAMTQWGTISRVIAKLTGMTIAAWINRKNGRSPLELANFTL
jgi:hypothetical protein